MNIQQLRERYAAPEIPKCRVCGGELTVQRAGGGPTIWGCTGMVDDPTGERNWIYAEGRSCADEHYERSRWSDYRQGGDADVIELIERLEAAERERDELRKVLQETQVGLIDAINHASQLQADLSRRDPAAGGVSCQHKWMNSQGRTASGWLCEKCGDYERPIDAQPAVLPHEGVSKALRDCDWSGVSIGKKAVICAAIDALGARPAVLPPAMTYAEALKVCDWKNDQASIWVEGANWMRQQCLELGAQQQKVVELPDPVKWPEIPFKYFSEEQVFSMLDAAGVKWEVKK